MVKHKSKGGFGINCLKSLNLALLAKWWWRLKSEENNFWSACIIALHKISRIDTKPMAKCSIPGVWLTISRINMEFANCNISLD
uniref:Reverse transcriptase zinc-binding domain-containing protein n=1 Tax=Lactuca sativa TaxID=4236 RepID=A0A9R1XF33_LACSA|nr:hypothetical protein LSAT_V11C400179540 [Lactuca sativa]